jgi:NADH-quinone oxidoreductase subunit J
VSVLGLTYFYACAALAIGGALAVVISKNPIRGAMGLLLLILSVAGLFAALHAQFLAAVQLIVYAGAIVVLFLFVIMLLGPSASTPRDSRGWVVRTFGGGLFALTGASAMAVVMRASVGPHHAIAAVAPDGAFGGIDAFGSVLFSDALAPFELSSALLMVAVVGAIAVARGRQGHGTGTLSKSERDAAASDTPRELPRDHSGVFGHESAGAEPLTIERDDPAHLPPSPTKEHSA